MKNILPHIYYLFIGFISSSLFTPLSIYIGNRFKIVDKPHEKRGEREKITPKIIPRSGGLTIYFSFLIISIILYIINPSKEIVSLILGGTVVFLTGFIDDKFNIRPWQKLIGEIGGAVIPILFGVKVNFITNPHGGYITLGWLSIPFTLLWVIGITNAINLIDGLDGLASGVVGIVTATLAFVAIEKGLFIVASLCFGLTGLTLGFLMFNFPPAKVYLGDSGSLFLGFVVGEIAVWGALKTTTSVILFVAILALGFPILDTFSSIIRRARKRKSIFEGDMEHIHYKLLFSGLKQEQVILILYLVTVFFSIISIIILKRFSL